MKLNKVILVVGIGAILTLSAETARAGDLDCTTTPALCGFGSQVGSSVTDTISPGPWTANLTSSAYQNGSVFTYVYTVALTGADQLSQLTTSSLGQDLFSNALHWGVMTSTALTTTGVDDCGDTGGIGCPAGATLGFFFGPSSFIINPSGLSPNTKFTFYVQSTSGPGSGTFSAQDGGVSNFNSSLDPTAVPEPRSIALLGTGLLGLALLARPRRVGNRRALA
jgi:hypothetical protein